MTTAINSDGFFCSKLINNSAHKIDNFLFCFSVLSPIKSVENCIVSKSVGGYSELSHPTQSTLNPGEEWNFKYGYEYSRHKPMNHRWAPQGGFLKVQNGNTIYLDMTDIDYERVSSVASILQVSGDKFNYESLRLVPHPYSWDPSAGVCNLCSPIDVVFDDIEIINSAYQSASELGSRLNLNLFSGTANEKNEK